MLYDDPELCPLCGRDNDCLIALGRSKCWCYEYNLTPKTLRQLQELLGESACLCRECLDRELGPEVRAQALRETQD